MVSQKKVPCAGRKFLLFIARFHRGFAVHLREEMIDEHAEVAGSVTERRDLQNGHGQAIEEVFAEVSGRDLLGQRPVGGGHNSHVDLQRLDRSEAHRPRLLESCAAALPAPAREARRARRGRACRRRRPRNSPSLGCFASVNAPFSCPKSSDSTSSAGIAPQLTAMNGRSRRGLARWIARASISLPVPDSPSTSTGTLRTATRRASWMRRLMTRLRWIMSTKLRSLWGLRGAALTQALVLLAEQVGDEIGGDLERHRSGADAVVLRRLDELSRESCLAEEDPDRGHGRRSRAQMKRQRSVARSVTQRALNGPDGGFMNLAELGRSTELLLYDLNARRAAAP